MIKNYLLVDIVMVLGLNRFKRELIAYISVNIGRFDFQIIAQIVAMVVLILGISYETFMFFKMSTEATLRVFLLLGKKMIFFLLATKNLILVSPILIFFGYFSPLLILLFPLAQILSYLLFDQYAQFKRLGKMDHPRKSRPTGYDTFIYLCQLMGYDYTLKMFLVPIGSFIMMLVLLQFDYSIKALLMTDDVILSAYFLSFWLFSTYGGCYALTLREQHFRYFTALGINGKLLRKRLLLSLSSLQFCFVFLALILFYQYLEFYPKYMFEFAIVFALGFIVVNIYQGWQARLERLEKMFDETISLTQRKVSWRIVVQSFLIKSPLFFVLVIQKSLGWTVKVPIVSLLNCFLALLISLYLFKKFEGKKSHEFITIKKYL
ncbi:MAG: hypothetical protein LBU51_08925 [Bacteroidales bacterium]|nr:hypothetical protein [Bacteroidales bacterium]